MKLQSGARAHYSRGDLCLSATVLTVVLAPAGTASAPGAIARSSHCPVDDALPILPQRLGARIAISAESRGSAHLPTPQTG